MKAAVLTGLSEGIAIARGSEVVELLPAVEQLLEGRVGIAVERTALAIAASLCRIEAKALQGRGIDVLTGQGSGESKLALLDQLHAALGLCSQTGNLGGVIVGGRRNGRWSGRNGGGIHEAGKGVARPGDESHQADEGNDLDVCGQAEATQLGAVMDEKVAVPEQAGRRR